jgi:hypothetical protein
MGIIDQFDIRYKELPANTKGQCNSREKGIYINSSIRSDRKEVKRVLLHEMIHAFEAIIPITYQQLLVVFYYNKLAGRLGKRKQDDLFSFDHHYINIKHAVIFLLKSLSLDLVRRLPLGTTCDGEGAAKRKNYANEMEKRLGNIA